MVRRALLAALALGLSALLTDCPAPTAEAPVQLGAAISLKAPLESAAAALRAQGLALTLSFGASGDLARQVAAGAPMDLLASAAPEPLAPLERSGQAHRLCTLASNRLVLVRGLAPDLADLGWANLATHPHLTHLAIGAAKVVPAGDYAEQALRSLGSWEQLGPKLVRGGNVRQVLELVARGEAEAGVVYATDAAGRSDVAVVGAPPEAAAPAILYPLDAVAQDRSGAAARVGAFLCGPEGRALLVAAGFLAP